MFDLLTAVRRVLDESRDLALLDLAELLTHHGATREELARELAHQRDLWMDKDDKLVAEVSGWLARGGRELQ